MRNTNGRRGQTSITHLMNFTLPPRPQYNSSLNRSARRNPTYGLGSGHHASDKARYIHANYRFIVNPTGEYHLHAIDADLHLDWSNVLQILASAESQTSACPICLSPPVAPRMAKCGHIFCLPCLIRYMHSTDDANPLPEKKARWKKCPICWDSVYISDTRPVRWFTGQESPAPREGDDVVLRLVMRQPGSTLALPRDGADAIGKSEDVPWYFAAEVMDYARVMKGSEDYIEAQYDEEIEQLLVQEKEDELMFGEETEWTRKAVNSIKEAKEKIKGIGNPPAAAKQPAEKKPKRQPIQYNESNDGVPDMYLVQQTAKSGQSLSAGHSTLIMPEPILEELSMPGVDTMVAQEDIPKLPTNPRAPAADGHHPDSPYFFYQALLHYYLAPLDIRILKAAFGSFASFPSTLLPRVERVSTGHIMDDDLRKRTKYLAHLPHGCEVGFLECNWTDVVGPEILEKFREEIERRRKRNRDKETKEEKDRLRAERIEDNERWAAVRRKRPSITKDAISGDDFQPLAPSSLDASGASPPWTSRQGSSFASLASPSTSPDAPRTVWGTTLIPSTSPDLTATRHSENDGDDGWLHDWEKELLAENDLIAQVQAASMNGEGSSSSMPMPNGGKKKKAKKITLMSTTARRAA
jgi:hypothetical protein